MFKKPLVQKNINESVVMKKRLFEEGFEPRTVAAPQGIPDSAREQQSLLSSSSQQSLESELNIDFSDKEDAQVFVQALRAELGLQPIHGGA